MSSILKSLVTAFVWTCLYLLGWCFSSNIPSFFTDLHRAVIFILAFIMELFYARLFGKFDVVLDRRGVRGVPSQDVVLLISLALQIAITIAGPYSDASGFLKMPDLWIIRTLGVLLFAISCALMLVSAITLGKLFSKSVNVQKDHTLVTTGIYGLLRHPWYVGMMLWGFGVAFTFLSIPAFILSLGLTGVYIWRARVEEAFMEQEFQEEWTMYAERTKKFIPYLY